MTADLALQLPPGGWRLLNTLYDGPSPSKQTAQALAARCGISPGDLADMAGNGLVYLVNRWGENVTPGIDMATHRLRLADVGIRWVQNNPANALLRRVGGANKRTLDLYQVLQQQMIETSTVRQIVEAGLASIHHANGRGEAVAGPGDNQWTIIFRYPRDFNVTLTGRGLHVLGRTT